MSKNIKSSCCSASRPKSNNSALKSQEKIMTVNKPSSNEMIYLPGGEFLMGTNAENGFPADGEGPIRKVKIKSFYMDKYAVTNEQFAEFIKETDYKTEAEIFGWSFVFYSFLSDNTARKVEGKVADTPWWAVVNGADWRKPEGSDSNIDNRMDHPVVHISWNDAMAYCKWAGKRFPTEAEWEYAARGGLEQKLYPWGDDLTPGGEHQCNIWQGVFPTRNTEKDDYIGTAPVNSFKPNYYGFYNMSGNVWEWCSDWFSRNIHKKGGSDNPQGPENGETKLLRGGSYLCHKSYCNRYRVAARSSNTPDSSTGNIGFRCCIDKIDR